MQRKMHQKIKNKKQKNRKNKMTYVFLMNEGEMPITSITMGDQEMGKYNTHNNNE